MRPWLLEEIRKEKALKNEKKKRGENGDANVMVIVAVIMFSRFNQRINLWVKKEKKRKKQSRINLINVSGFHCTFFTPCGISNLSNINTCCNPSNRLFNAEHFNPFTPTRNCNLSIKSATSSPEQLRKWSNNDSRAVIIPLISFCET